MKKEIDLYIDEISFLLDLKKIASKLDNRLHDKLALLSIQKFEEQFPKIKFHYGNAGQSGIDITGFDNKKKRIFVAEVKTTITPDGKSLQGAQLKHIKPDLERLEKDSAPNKFFIVLSDRTKIQIEKQLNTKKYFPSVHIINMFKK